MGTLKQKGIHFVAKSAAARLAASALLVAFDENGRYANKYSDVPDDAEACTEMLSREPFDVDAHMLRQNISRRAFTLRFNESNMNSNMNSFSSATANDGLAEFFRSSVKRKVANDSAMNISTSSTKRTVSDQLRKDKATIILRN